MKKILTAALTMVFMLSIGSRAAVLASSGSAPVFSVDNGVTAPQGGTITVPISVSNNPGFAAAGLRLTYDPNVLEITGVSAPSSGMQLNSQFSLTSTPGTQWISLLNTNGDNWYGDGTVADVTFHVKSNAALRSSSVSLSFTSSPDGTPANANGTLLRNSQTYSGNVSVVDSGSYYNDPYYYDPNYYNNNNPYPNYNDGYNPGSGSGSDGYYQPPNNSGGGGYYDLSYGRAPQTDVPDIAKEAALAILSIAASAALCVYLARLLNNRKKPGNG